MDTDIQLIIKNSESIKNLMIGINSTWPSLRATTIVEDAVDVDLIPRAMQIEDDWVRCINEYHSLKTIQRLV